MAAKFLTALVLSDIVSHGLKAGQVVEATPALITALSKDGSVDSHKDAVAHARSHGAPTVRSSIELAADQRADQRDALLAEIAKAEEALKAATEEAVKAALERDLDARREQLAALDV